MSLIVGTLGVMLAILTLASLVCCILTIVKMFQNGDTGLGIVTVLLLLLCGFGGLVSFIMGWVKVNEYDNRTVMTVWTTIVIISILLGAFRGILHFGVTQ